MKEMKRINGVPTDGSVAYWEGVMAGDCPYFEEDPDFNRWNNEWDAAADEHEAIKPPKVGSVVTDCYRARYSESGHPTHCGDDLANLLNSLCSNKKGTNLDLFELICSMNGVDLSKYNRTTKGWQGRLRMTGRNLLVKSIIKNGGKLSVPEWLGEDHQFSGDWVQEASNKYKPKQTEQT
jgi:hypothetical protein